ncbi:MAG TPA: efflux RND transporter periplasmic adaptor subunit [Vicinamibacterales bacterium]|nr:efflux RND transporter periplasmic adaptor subunit [Vicinamibacterales bacterium]
MRRILLILVAAAVLAGGAWYLRSGNTTDAATPDAAARAGGPSRGGAGARTAMTVDLAPVTRQEVVDSITVVGNLIGEATVDIVPRVAGRLDAVMVKLGDRVSKGQTVAKIEDREIREQLNQVQATLDVNKANVKQREDESKLQESVLERTKATYQRGLVSKQLLEDAELRYNAAISQLNVAKAQKDQTQFRIDELRITLGNTTIISPIDGFVSRRNLDQGGFAGTNTVILTVVDLGTVRMVGNLVEKGFRKITPGVAAVVQVDTFPGEDFAGQVSRVAPVFDPATRTAPMEIEVPNPGFRLKPGMYARVRLTVDRRPNALTVPRAAVVDLDGKRGAFIVQDNVAKFVPVTTGLSDGERIEILDGLQEGQRVVTTGAVALQNNDRVALPADNSSKGRGREQGASPAGRGDGRGK